MLPGKPGDVVKRAENLHVRVEAATGVNNRELQVGLGVQPDLDLVGTRVLRGVLERLEDAEVDGALDLRREPSDVMTDEVDLDRAPRRTDRSASSRPRSASRGG